MSWNGGAVYSTGVTTPVVGKWYHLATTWDATNGLRLFVNGALDASTPQAVYSASGGSNYLFAALSPGGCAGNTDYFKGSIDEMRVYDRALSAAEVYQLYNSGRTTLQSNVQ